MPVTNSEANQNGDIAYPPIGRLTFIYRRWYLTPWSQPLMVQSTVRGSHRHHYCDRHRYSSRVKRCLPAEKVLPIVRYIALAGGFARRTVPAVTPPSGESTGGEESYCAGAPLGVA